MSVQQAFSMLAYSGIWLSVSLLSLLSQRCHAGDCKDQGRSVDIILVKNWDVKKPENIQVVAKLRETRLAVHDDKKHLSKGTKTFYNHASQFYRLCAKNDCDYTKDTCETQAKLHDLAIGGNGYEFAGHKFPNLDLYYEHGCYAYYSGDFAGMAFYGYVDDKNTEVTKESQLGPVSARKYRVPGTFGCDKEGKCVAPLSKHDEESDTCRADTDKQTIERDGKSIEIDDGEAAQIRQAMELVTGNEKPPAGLDKDAGKSDWLTYVVGMSVHRSAEALKVEKRHGGYEAKSYVLALTPGLEPLVAKHGKNLYLLSCKDATSDLVFEHANIVREINKALNLWPEGKCPAGQAPLKKGGGGSSVGVIIAIILALVLAGVGGFFAYQKFGAGAGARSPAMSAKSDAQQQQVELAEKINTYQAQ